MYFDLDQGTGTREPSTCFTQLCIPHNAVCYTEYTVPIKTGARLAFESNRMKLTNIGLIVVFAVCTLTLPVGAQQFDGNDLVYFRGLLDGGMMLKTLLPPAMAASCGYLEHGDLIKAEPKFAAALKHDPDNPALIVGFLQAESGHRDALLGTYLRAAAVSHSEGNEFRLAVLAYYMMGERWYSAQSPTQKHYLDYLRNIAVPSLHIANDKARSPVVGFFTLTTGRILHYYDGVSSLTVLQGLLKRFEGPAIYGQYVSAKNHAWRVSTPNVPAVTYNQLFYARYIVEYMLQLGQNKHYLCSTVGGKTVMTDITPKKSTTEKDMYDFLGRWRTALNSALRLRKPNRPARLL